MKNYKKNNTPNQAGMLSRRGRPAKIELEKALKNESQRIAEKFKFNPLRQPIDEQFRPYYERFLHGDLRAIEEYCNASLYLGDGWDCGIGPFASFHEMIGRLFLLRHHHPAVNQILPGIDRAVRTNRQQNPQRIYEHLYESLLPRCQRARQFISGSSRPDSDENKEALWHDYTQGEGNELETLAESDPLSKNVPREIFFDLLLTRRRSVRRPFVFTPAAIARKYACRIAGISQGTVSHKTVRK